MYKRAKLDRKLKSRIKKSLHSDNHLGYWWWKTLLIYLPCLKTICQLPASCGWAQPGFVSGGMKHWDVEGSSWNIQESVHCRAVTAAWPYFHKSAHFQRQPCCDYSRAHLLHTHNVCMFSLFSRNNRHSFYHFLCNLAEVSNYILNWPFCTPLSLFFTTQ